jgi:hypothetical protein
MRQSQRVDCPKTGHAASSGRNNAARTSESNRRGSMINNRFEEEVLSPLDGFDYDAMGEACGRAQRLCDVMSFGCLALLHDSQGQQVSYYLYLLSRPYTAYTCHSAFTPMCILCLPEELFRCTRVCAYAHTDMHFIRTYPLL